jgi:hypothetical protein
MRFLMDLGTQVAAHSDGFFMCQQFESRVLRGLSAALCCWNAPIERTAVGYFVPARLGLHAGCGEADGRS